MLISMTLPELDTQPRAALPMICRFSGGAKRSAFCGRTEIEHQLQS